MSLNAEMEAINKFIERLKIVKQINLSNNDNVLRRIEYADNYGCTINSFTTNGDCGVVYREYLHLISSGFKEVETDQQQEDKYTTDNPLKLGLKMEFNSNSKPFICYEEDGICWWALGGLDKGTREPIPRMLYDYLVMFRESNPLPRLYETHFSIK